MRKGRFLESAIVQLGLISLSIFALFPFVWMALTSIKSKTEVYTSPPTWIPNQATLQHYQTLLQMKFGRFFFNSVLVAGLAMLIIVAVSALAAYGFSRFRFRGRDTLFASTLMGQLLPVSVMFVPFYMIMTRLKLLDTYSSLIIVYVATLLPFAVWMLTGYLDAIPRALDEAAMIDGCNRTQTLIHILLPPAMPGIVSVALYAFIVAWQEFLFALIFVNNVNKRTLPLALVAFRGQYEINWGSMMAAALTTTLPLTLLFVFFQRRLIVGLTGGAVKE